jgi:hypothetical protein
MIFLSIIDHYNIKKYRLLYDLHGSRPDNPRIYIIGLIINN